eukprot:8741388-Lingulodinium_polyedra.AAC.1
MTDTGGQTPRNAKQCKRAKDRKPIDRGAADPIPRAECRQGGGGEEGPTGENNCGRKGATLAAAGSAAS